LWGQSKYSRLNVQIGDESPSKSASAPPDGPIVVGMTAYEYVGADQPVTIDHPGL